MIVTATGVRRSVRGVNSQQTSSPLKLAVVLAAAYMTMYLAVLGMGHILTSPDVEAAIALERSSGAKIFRYTPIEEQNSGRPGKVVRGHQARIPR